MFCATPSILVPSIHSLSVLLSLPGCLLSISLWSPKNHPKANESPTHSVSIIKTPCITCNMTTLLVRVHVDQGRTLRRDLQEAQRANEDIDVLLIFLVAPSLETFLPYSPPLVHRQASSRLAYALALLPLSAAPRDDMLFLGLQSHFLVLLP